MSSQLSGGFQKRTVENSTAQTLSIGKSRHNTNDLDLPISSHPLDRYLNSSEQISAGDLKTVRDILNLSYLPSIKVFRLSDLADTTYEEILQVDSTKMGLTEREEKLLVLRHFIDHTINRWATMKASGLYVEEDPPELLIKLATAPSSHLIVLRATKLEEQDKISTDYSHFLGYGLLQTDRNDFPDAQDIAPEIFEMGEIYRGLRIMVNNVGNLIVPDNGAVRMIIDQVKNIIDGGILVTKILSQPRDLAYRWSKRALEHEGFYDTGYTVSQISEYQGKEVTVTYNWFALSNSTEEGANRLKLIEERYELLDIATRQRFADTFAHFAPHDACLAVWSSDSGSDVARYGSIYEDNYVLGIELRPKTTPDYQFNVRHINGNDALQLVPPNIFDGIINLSILSEIVNMARAEELESISGDTPIEIIESLFRKQLAMTASGEKILTREWLVPDSWGERVIIEVNECDGRDEGTIDQLEKLSTAKRLEYYSKYAPSLDGDSIGFPLKRLPCAREGFSRFELEAHYALGFAMVKDYTSRSDFLRECAKVPYFKPSQICQTLEKCGARVVSSEPRFNQYIIDNRIREKIYFYSLDGAKLDNPPTQYIVLAEKIRSSQGVKFTVSDLKSITKPEYLKASLYRDSKTGIIREVVARPGQTIEFRVTNSTGSTLIVDDFPRPILIDELIEPKLEEASISAYVHQSHCGVIDPRKNLKEEALRILKRTGIKSDDISSISFGVPYLPSPGSTDELIIQCDVTLNHEGFRERTIQGSYSGFSESGRLRMMPEDHILQALQAGSFLDERIVRRLMLNRIKNNLPLGPCIADKIKLTPQDKIELKISSTKDLLDMQYKKDNKVRWEQIPIDQRGFKYLDVKSVLFLEKNLGGNIIATSSREFIQPLESSGISSNTIITAPMIFNNGRPALVLYLREDLPVIEYQLGLNALLTPPAYRLPRTIKNFEECDRFLLQALEADFGLKLLRTELTPIGRWFPPSSGVLNERNWLRVAEIAADSIDPNKVIIVDLEECAKTIALQGSYCGNLQTAVFRLYHNFY